MSNSTLNMALPLHNNNNSGQYRVLQLQSEKESAITRLGARAVEITPDFDVSSPRFGKPRCYGGIQVHQSDISIDGVVPELQPPVKRHRQLSLFSTPPMARTHSCGSGLILSRAHGLSGPLYSRLVWGKSPGMCDTLPPLNPRILGAVDLEYISRPPSRMLRNQTSLPLTNGSATCRKKSTARYPICNIIRR
jgi:hypothetical protein